MLGASVINHCGKLALLATLGLVLGACINIVNAQPIVSALL